MPARRITPPEAPPTPVEERGKGLGLKFTRGRTTSSYSHPALEAAEFALEHAPDPWAFHKRIFKAYFEDLEDIGDVEVLIRLAEEMGLDAAALRRALKEGLYREAVDEGINWSRSIGVTAIPTFVFNERLGMVGAQELPAMREMMARVGNTPKNGGSGG